METIISVKNLIKKYKKADQNAVDSISFSVAKGELFAFLGPNGAGKTTTISILTTRLSKTSGEVTIAGYELEKDASKIRSQIGIIFQNPSLDINLTGEQNIRFHSILYGLYSFAPSYYLMPETYKQRVEELAGLIGIKDDIFKPVKTYSGGMKRKLEIIRSIMHAPQVLFLDEPTVGLDPESRQNLWEYLQNLRKTTNITMFLTTHYLDEVEEADNVCIINKGKIVASGTPNEIKGKIAKEYILMRPFDIEGQKMLEAELQSFGHIYSVEQNDIKVTISDDTNAQEIIQQVKTKLKFLDIKRVSLEDAYIEIIKDTIQ